MDIYAVEPMKPKEMEEYLRAMKRTEKELPLLLENIQKMRESFDECIRRNTLHGETYEEGRGGNGPADTVYRVLMSTYREMKEHRQEMGKEIELVLKAEKKLSLVKRSIRNLQPESADYITYLYIKGITVKDYALTNNLGETSVYRGRKSALYQLTEIYNRYFTKEG